MIAAMYLLVGLYIYFQYDSSLIRDTGRFVRLMMFGVRGLLGMLVPLPMMCGELKSFRL
jgi:hypothetical protein